MRQRCSSGVFVWCFEEGLPIRALAERWGVAAAEPAEGALLIFSAFFPNCRAKMVTGLILGQPPANAERKP
jgi:hypothetical protein